MKKMIATMLILISSLTNASATNDDLIKYMKNKDVVLQVLGAVDHYSDRCYGLTDTGKQYYELALITINFNRDTLKRNSLYKQGYIMAKHYPTCESIKTDFNLFGIGHFLADAK